MYEPEIRLEDDGEDAPVLSVAVGAFACDDRYLDIAPDVEFGEPEEWSAEPTLAERIKAIERELLAIDRRRARLFPRVKEFHKVRLLLSAINLNARTMGADFFRYVDMDTHQRRVHELTEQMAELSGAGLEFEELRQRTQVLAQVHAGMRARQEKG